MSDTNQTPRQTTKRSEWIAQRAAELMASGWKSQAMATQRATKEWRNQCPQHLAARRRNAALEAARHGRGADQVAA